MPSNYLPILLFIVVALLFGFGGLLAGLLVRPRRPYAEKLTPYESGNIPIGETRHRFSVSFYLIAMLFVVFDVEAVFLYPWAVVFDQIGMYAFVEMVLFITVLVVGYVYAWRKGALDWDK